MSAIPSSYQPHIDGLRAVAILSVLFYHAGLGCPGGYVGVDVFFVISGYLITSLILKDLRDDKFSLVGFWERRLRRIFPALAATVLVTLVAGWFLLLPEHLEKLGKSTIAQALLSANFYFWRTTNYFGGANDEKPLLHTWSLAVEEQFYLFFPLILVFLFRRPELRRPRALVAILLAGFAASLGVAVWGVKHQPYATFFLLPTRAWELVCGALVAVLPVTAMPVSRPVREAASWLGLVGICLPVCLYHDNTPFPGLAALPPCLGTTLLIWANSNSSAGTLGTPFSARTLPAALLSFRGMVFIGLISYSLYLWHWPVMMFTNYWKTAPLSAAVRWSLVAVALGLAVLSWRYIETPFRNRRLCKTRRGIFFFLASASALSIVFGTALIAANGFPNRIPETALAVVQAVKQNAEVWKRYASVNKNMDDLSEVQNDSLARLGSSDSSAPLKFLVLGDSHAGGAIPIFDQLAREQGIAGAAITYQGTPPLFGWQHHFPLSAKDSDRLWQAALAYAQRNKISDIFLVAYWSNYQQAAGATELEQVLSATLKIFQSNGFKVYVVLDHPTYEGDVVRALVRKTLFPKLAPAIYVSNEDDHRKKNSALYALWQKISGPSFLDPSPFLLNPQSRNYVITEAGAPLYYDHDHLTLAGEKIALLPLLQPIFEKELALAQLSSNAQARVPNP